MSSRIFTPSIRPSRAPRHEAGDIPRYLIPCRYFARGYCGRGESCMFSHSFYNTMQSRGLRNNCHTAVPFWKNHTTLPPQSHTERHCEIRYSSPGPYPITVPPPSPSSSVTTPDEASPPFNLHLPVGSSPTPSTIITDITPADSALGIRTQASTIANGDTSCDELYTTRSDVARDEFLSPSTDVHFAEFCPLTSYHPIHFAPVPYVQRGFGYRDNCARNRDNRRRRRKAKIILSAENPRRVESPARAVLQGAEPQKSGTTSDSDSTSMKPHQESWRVIGGGVMLGTATNTPSRRKSKRLQSCARATKGGGLDGLYNESLDSSRSADESLEFSHLVASVKLTINRPPLPDIIERPKSSLPPAKVFPRAAFFTHAEVA